MREGFDSIQRTAAAIAKEVKDMAGFVLPGGVHEDFIGNLQARCVVVVS
jgi:hypothetical protein